MKLTKSSISLEFDHYLMNLSLSGFAITCIENSSIHHFNLNALDTRYQAVMQISSTDLTSNITAFKLFSLDFYSPSVMSVIDEIAKKETNRV